MSRTIICITCNTPTRNLGLHIRRNECSLNLTAVPRAPYTAIAPAQVPRASILPSSPPRQRPPSQGKTHFETWKERRERARVDPQAALRESIDVDPYLVADSDKPSQRPIGEGNRSVQEEEEELMASIKKSVVDQLAGFDFLDNWVQERCARGVEKTPIFPTLVAYAYTHIANCGVSDSKTLDDFEGEVDEWQNGGQLWCLQNLKKVFAVIRNSLAKPRTCQGRCARSLLANSDVPSSDLAHLASAIVVTLRGTDTEKAKALYAIEGENIDAAYSLIDLLHYLLEQGGCKKRHRRTIWDALIRLSKRHGYYPEGLYLRNVKIRTGDALGRGGFGEVRVGELRGRSVAVKLLKQSSIPEGSFAKMAYNEIIVWRQLRHPNILPFYGVYKEMDQINLVSPLMQNGCLSKYLEINPQADRLRLILDIIRGLEYLHTMKPTIVHGDLKGENILITASGRACLADFGLAASKDSQNVLQTMRERHSGTFNYMAPELLLESYAGRNLDYRFSDMYAFACVCFEMFSRRPPFKGYTMGQILNAIALNKREDKPENAPLRFDESIWQFIQNCWSQEPEDRLTATDARQYIELVVKGAQSEHVMSIQDARGCEDEEWDEGFMRVAVSMFNPLRLEFDT